MTIRERWPLLDRRSVDDAPGILRRDHYHLGYFDSPDLDLQSSQARHVEELCRQQSPSAGDIVVDVGCGLGNTARWIRQRFGSAVVGIDLLDVVLQKSRALDDLPLAQGDMTRLPLRRSSVDLIVGIESLYGFPHRQVAFDEFGRALRPGGVMLLSEFILGDEADRLSTRVVSSVVHTNSLCPEAVYRSQLHDAGFVEISMIDVGEFTAVGTAAFLKSQAALRRDLFAAQLGQPRGALFSMVGFPLFYKLWCDAFMTKRCRHVFVTARRRD
ncbi:MAG: methyltransferase domain-containing protein [Acidimicrobiales bacterium]